MDDKLIWFSRVIAILISLYIINRARKKFINEKESLFWVFGSIIFIIIAFFPSLLNFVSKLIGIQYPPATLFLIAILFIVLLLYREFEKRSFLSHQINDLVRTNSILALEVEILKKDIHIHKSELQKTGDDFTSNIKEFKL